MLRYVIPCRNALFKRAGTRISESSRSILFLGCRGEYDRLYEDEWEQLEETGTLRCV